MAATDGQVVAAASRWCDEGSYLREFAIKNRLPSVAKIIKGQYGGLGVPTQTLDSMGHRLSTAIQ